MLIKRIDYSTDDLPSLSLETAWTSGQDGSMVFGSLKGEGELFFLPLLCTS